MGSLVALCVLTVVLGFVKTELQNKEFTLGGKLTLKPAALTSSISSITWMTPEGSKLVEQLSSTSKPLSYGRFEGRVDLIFETGELLISKLTEKDAGKYTVRINDQTQHVGYQVKIIKPVPVPMVVVQPLACSETSPNCKLDCQGDVTGAGTVRYFWKEDGGDWKRSAKKKEIKNDADMQKIKEFFCKVSNSVSDEESPATKNPFYKETSSSAGVVIVIIILGVIVISAAVEYKTGFFRKCVQKKTDKTTGKSLAKAAKLLIKPKESNSPATGADGGSATEPATKSDPAPTPSPEPL